jgi:hypothetical protein
VEEFADIGVHLVQPSELGAARSVEGIGSQIERHERVKPAQKSHEQT